MSSLRDIDSPRKHRLMESNGVKCGFRLSDWKLQGVVLGMVILGASDVFSQSPRAVPRRAKPPELKESDFQGVFFADVKSQLIGNRAALNPNATSAGSGNSSMSGTNGVSQGSDQGNAAAASPYHSWSSHISSESIEAFVKGSRSKLDQLVTTPAKFADGSYKECRREFELLAIMFLAIEHFDGDVRWKSSAAVARERFSKAAAASKVASSQAYQEAKNALQDLVELLNRGQLAGTPSTDEVDWGSVVDRNMVMQMIENSLREVLLRSTNNANEFTSNQEKLIQHAEFLALVGDLLQLEGMPSSDEKEYLEMCLAMTTHATDLAEAAKQANLDRCRSILGLIDQTCTKCHDAYK